MHLGKVFSHEHDHRHDQIRGEFHDALDRPQDGHLHGHAAHTRAVHAVRDDSGDDVVRDVISGVVATGDVRPGELRTVEGNSLTAAVQGGKVSMNGIHVVQGNIAASNGLIHAIDGLLMPKSVKLAAVA
jgi:hypothetical protein